jgi:hypothetical protein
MLLLAALALAAAAEPALNPLFSASAEQMMRSEQIELLVEESLVACRPSLTNFAQPILPCDRVSFMETMLRLKHEHTEFVANGPTGTGTTPELQRVESPAFKDFFDTYAIPGKPVVITNEQYPNIVGALTDEENSAAPYTQLMECAAKSEDPSSISVDCPYVAKQDSMVPKYVASDYFQRLPAGDQLAPLKRFPAVFAAKPGGAKLHQCPIGANMLLLVLQGDLKVEVFEREHAAWLYPDGPRWSKPALNSPHAAKADRHTGTVKAQEALFAPSGSVVSTAAEGAEQALVMQYCYIDASNFPDAMAELFYDAMVDEASRSAYQYFMYSRRADKEASENGSPLFSNIMEREPELLNQTWSRYRAWPRTVDKAALAIRMRANKKKKKDAFKNWQAEKQWEARVAARTLTPPLQPTVVDIGRKNVTLRFTNPGEKREDDDSVLGYKITWVQEGRDGSGKVVGEASFIEVNDTDAKRVPRPEGDTAKDILVVQLGSLLPNTTYSFTIAVYMGTNEDISFGPASLRSAAYNTMPEGVAATVQLAPWLQKDGSGAHALSLHFPKPVDDGGSDILYYLIQIRKEIGYVRHQRHLVGEGEDAAREEKVWKLADHQRDEHYDHNLKIRPSVVSLGGQQLVPASVNNLVPNTTYIVRVAAVNARGVSQFSAKSEGLKTALPSGWSQDSTGNTKREGETGSIYGHGHPHFQFHHEGYDAQRLGVIVHLFDAKEELMVSPMIHDGDEHEAPFLAETWSSHHNPGHHDVVAEVVMADPPLADKPLLNAHQARHRLLLVDRGGVPLLHKVRVAQDAGAIGVLIADGGKCNNTFDQICCPGADKSRNEGFAAPDPVSQWKTVHIPVALLHKADADKIKELIAKEAGKLKPDSHVLEKVHGKPYFVYVDVKEQERRAADAAKVRAAAAAGGTMSETVGVGADGSIEPMEISVSPAAAAKKEHEDAQAKLDEQAKEEAAKKAAEDAKKAEEEKAKKAEEEKAKKLAEEEAAKKAEEDAKKAEEAKEAEDQAAQKAAAEAKAAGDAAAGDAAAKAQAEETKKKNDEEFKRRQEAAKKAEEEGAAAAKKAEEDAAAAATAAAANSKFKLGETVEAQYMGSITFYGGTVQSINADGSYVIMFDDGDTDGNVPEGNVQAPA